MIIPYQAHVAMHRWPIANFVLIGVIVSFTIAVWLQLVPEHLADAMVLDGWSVTGMVGSLFMHLDVVHLIGNMVFLWVFGNAVCAKVGNLLYVPLFCLYGMAGGVAHLLLSGGPAVGASDGINGVVAMFLVWYPINKVSCCWWIYRRCGQFDIDSRWLILIYLAFDVWGVVRGGGGVGYAAHIGGFVAGFSLAFVLTYFSVFKMTRNEVSLLDLMGIKAAAATVDGDEDSEWVEVPLPKPDKLRFVCSGCGKAFAVAREHAGRKAKCPRCQNVITIPMQSIA